MMIETRRLRLVPFRFGHAVALDRGRPELAAALRVEIPDGWPRFPEAYTSESFRGRDNDPGGTMWGTYLFLDRTQASLVGSGGFKGEPLEGGVEVGYEIAPEFENQGFATEATMAMIAEAFSHPKVEFVLAHTLPSRSASTRVLEKSGMEFMGAIDDPQDGPVWRWQVSKAT